MFRKFKEEKGALITGEHFAPAETLALPAVPPFGEPSRLEEHSPSQKSSIDKDEEDFPTEKPAEEIPQQTASPLTEQLEHSEPRTETKETSGDKKREDDDHRVF